VTCKGKFAISGRNDRPRHPCCGDRNTSEPQAQTEPGHEPLERRWCGPHDLGVFKWLRRRQEGRRLVQADAEALIRDYGPDEAYLATRGLARQALV
jgi:hypothetical protein